VLKENGEQKLKNLDQVEKDMEVMNYVFEDILEIDQVEDIYDPSFKELDKKIQLLDKNFERRHARGENTLLFVYFSGHGYMDQE